MWIYLSFSHDNVLRGLECVNVCKYTYIYIYT